jgi:transcriptional regulator
MVYLPPHFEMNDRDRIAELIAAHPLATLVTLGPDGMAANHIPLLFDPDRGEHGTLVGHVARNNDLWREGQHDGESLAIFQGVDAYISPTWYASKQVTHEVVPTWNYAVVHARGPLVIHDSEKWVRAVVGRLTTAMEQHQPVRWRMGEAPQAYLATMLANIVGIEIPVSRLTGKWKASQNRTADDQASAIDGLRGSAGPSNEAMAHLSAVTNGISTGE